MALRCRPLDQTRRQQEEPMADRVDLREAQPLLSAPADLRDHLVVTTQNNWTSSSVWFLVLMYFLKRSISETQG